MSIVGIVMIAIINNSCIAIKTVEQIFRMQTLHGSITRPLVSKSGCSARQFSVKVKVQCIVSVLCREEGCIGLNINDRGPRDLLREIARAEGNLEGKSRSLWEISKVEGNVEGRGKS